MLRKRINWLPVMMAMELAACGTADINPPVATLVAPASQSTFNSASALTIETAFSDDTDLLQYTLTVLIEEDPTADVAHMEVPFTFGQSYGLLGKQETKAVSLPIPLMVATGIYVVEVWCVDRNGNLSDKQQVRVRIANSFDNKAPQLTLQQPASTFTTGASSVISIQGTMSDDVQLGGVFAYITEAGSPDIIRREVVGYDTKSAAFNFTITAPSIPGTYRLTVAAADKVNNRTLQEIQLTVN